MNKKKYLLISILSIVSMLVIMTGCNNKKEEIETKEIYVAAASDLTKAFTELGELFEKEYNCKVTFNFGSTGILKEQIANGAPFDVFAAADEKAILELEKNGIVKENSSSLYALGRIGLVIQTNSQLEVIELEDLLKSEIKKIAIANPDHAPYGLAAKQALESTGLWDKIKDKLVYGKNVSDTMTLVTTGNAEAGIIALSLKDDSQVKFSLLDEALHKPLRQAMGIIKTTKNEDLSQKFVEYVNSSEGREIMTKYGFTKVEE